MRWWFEEIHFLAVELDSIAAGGSNAQADPGELAIAESLGKGKGGVREILKDRNHASRLMPLALDIRDLDSECLGRKWSPLHASAAAASDCKHDGGGPTRPTVACQ